MYFNLSHVFPYGIHSWQAGEVLLPVSSFQFPDTVCTAEVQPIQVHDKAVHAAVVPRDSFSPHEVLGILLLYDITAAL